MPRVIEVIESIETFGNGSKEAPRTTIRSIYTLRGELLAESVLEQHVDEQKEVTNAE